MKASSYRGSLKEFLTRYKYQPDLTKRLDNLGDTNYTQQLMNEIVLWKLNRYVLVDRGMIRRINGLKTLEPEDHRKAENVLADLLQVRGVDLPIASTILRFRNPRTFQIIDRHSYRGLYGTKYPLRPSSNVKSKVELYSKYLSDLWVLCRARRLKFQSVDRLLYVFDKELNGSLNS